jgi:hypothetical protein
VVHSDVGEFVTKLLTLLMLCKIVLGGLIVFYLY